MVNHVAAPGAHFSPAVQHGHGLDAVGGGTLDVLIQLPELITDGSYIVNELRKLQGQFQVAAVADAVNGLAENGPPGSDPVFLGFLYRVAALVERIREEVGQEPALGVLDAGDVGNQPQGGAVAHGTHHRVYADGLPLLHKRLGADPVVPQEHHGFLAQFVGDVHHFLGKLGHFPTLERLEVLEFLGGYPVLVVVIALVHNVLRAELVAHFLFKLFQDVGGDRGGVAVPVHKLFPFQFVKHQSELMEEGGVADDVDVRMLRNELPQPLHGELVGLGLANVKGDLMLKVLPVVGHGIVHMHRIPDEVGQECHGVLMERLGLVDDHAAGFLVIVPGFRGNGLACGPVHDFPPTLDVVPGVDLHQLRGNAFHQRDFQGLARGGIEAGHNIALLHLVRIGLGPGVVFPGGVVGGVDFGILPLKLCGKIGAVTVPDGIRAPTLHNFQRFGYHIQIRWDGHPANFSCVRHRKKPPVKSPLGWFVKIDLRLPLVYDLFRRTQQECCEIL